MNSPLPEINQRQEPSARLRKYLSRSNWRQRKALSQQNPEMALIVRAAMRAAWAQDRSETAAKVVRIAAAYGDKPVAAAWARYALKRSAKAESIAAVAQIVADIVAEPKRPVEVIVLKRRIVKRPA